MKESEIFITCHPHIGPFLAEEVKSLGYEILEVGIKGVLTTGSYFDTMRLNINLRTANRVLFKIADFESRDVKVLY